MARDFIEIENVSQGYEDRVKQKLGFKTGKFVWRCRFTTALDPATINSSNLFVQNDSGVKMATKFTYNDETMEIELEPLEPYAQDTDYFLHITTKVKSKGGQKLKEPIQVKFRL